MKRLLVILCWVACWVACSVYTAGVMWGQISPPTSSSTAPDTQLGPGCVAMGDSLTARDDDNVNNVHADSYINYASYAAASKFYVIRNSGVGGNTSAQMLARFQTDVVNYKPRCVAILAGTNDTTPLSQTLPNIKSMVKQALTAGIVPILATIPPSGTAAISAPTITATGAITGGTLAAATYAYRVTAVNGAGETTPSSEVTTSVASGTTGSVTVTWPAVQGATGYRIYGRTTGAELFIAYNNNSGGQSRPSVSYTDTGAITPSGAMPGANTTAVALSAATRTKDNQVNGIVSAIAQAYGLPLVDFYGLLVDPTSGMYKTGYTIDGTHPTDNQSKQMGQLWATTVGSRFIWKPYIAMDNSDATVLYTNPLFTSNNGTIPTGWGPFGGSGAAESMTTDAAVSGSVYQIARTDATSRFSNSPNLTGWSVGDVLSMSGYVKVVGADANGGQAKLVLNQVGGSTGICTMVFNSDTPGGWIPFYCEGTVPTGCTQIYIQTGLNYGPVTLSLAQITVRDLTVLGIRPFSL